MVQLQYYLKSSVRRKKLDKLLAKFSTVYHGIVLDIGGRDRGKFRKPKSKVEKWIFADINETHNPDIVLDVSNMKQVENESIDVVNAIELFEHVKEIELALKECYRVLKPNGKLVVSAPFLIQVHADPNDYQRWTDAKWKLELGKNNFKIQNFEIMGRFFSLLSHIFRTFVLSLPFGLKHFMYILFPFVDIFLKLDSTRIVLRNNTFRNFHGGYFIIAQRLA